MARPPKQGLEYFALDVAMNDEVELIEAVHGLAGFAILIKLFQKIYSEGYFIDWHERDRILFSNRVSGDRNQVTSVVSDCIRWGIFDQESYDKHGILTSRRIQDQYFTATYKRVNVIAIKEYLLVDVSGKDHVVVMGVSDDGNGTASIVSDDRNKETSRVSDDKSTQSKSKSKSKSKSQSKSESNISTLLLNSDLSPSGESAPESMPESKEVKRNLNQERFDEFWSLYPRKVGKQAALKAWRKIRPDADLHAKIVAAVNSQKTTEQWTIENGRFVPNPTTWLNQGRWDDELPKGNGQSGGRQGPYVSERDRIKEAHEYDHPTDIKYSPVFQAFYEKELAKKAQEEQNHD